MHACECVIFIIFIWFGFDFLRERMWYLGGEGCDENLEEYGDCKNKVKIYYMESEK